MYETFIRDISPKTEVTQDPRKVEKDSKLVELLDLTNQDFIDAFLENPSKTASYSGLFDLLESNGLPTSGYYGVNTLCNDLSRLLYDLKTNPDYKIVSEKKEVLRKAQELVNQGQLGWKITANSTPTRNSEVLRGEAELDGYKIFITQVHTWRRNGKPFHSTRITNIEKIKK